MKALKGICLLVLVCFSTTLFGNEGLEAKFETANAAYASGDFETALTNYREINASHHSAALHFNLGNTYFKLDRLGLAILHFEKAKRLAPADADIQYNLDFANQQVVDNLPRSADNALTTWFKGFAFGHADGYWNSITVLLFFIGFGLLAVYLFVKVVALKKLFFYTGGLVLLAGVLSFGLSIAHNNYLQVEDSGIVLAPKVNVKTAPDSSSEDVFILHEGAKLEVTRQDDEWIEVALPDGNGGWIRSEDLALI